MLASIAKTPELELEPKEAEKLAEGIQGVARHYIQLPSGEMADWINLFTALGIIYGSRIFAIQSRQRKPVEQSPHDAQVFALHPAQ